MSIASTIYKQAKNPYGLLGSLLVIRMNWLHNHLVAFAMSKFSFPENSSVLDIGCGGGKAINLFASDKNTKKVIGLDYSLTCVKKSIKKNSKFIKSGKVEIINGSVQSLPFNEREFDIITAFQTHLFWPNLKEGLKEINRVLKIGGFFIIGAEEFKLCSYNEPYRSPKEYEELFKSCGFNKVMVYTRNKEIYVFGWK
jgi:ubiquinone/menaquinone biosynthesis C-methylase UbiE